MITIKSEEEIEFMREAGHLNYLTREYLKTIVKPGITTKEIDDLCGKYIESIGGKPGFKGYGGFPGNICISVNEEVVHGIPSDRVLKEGDIVSLDVGVMAHGYHSDACITIPVGKISHEKEMLLKHTEDALYAGIKEVKDGAKLGNVSARIESTAKKHKLGVVRELCGHGVGKDLHEDPDVLNYGKYGTGITLKEGMVIAIEPMLTLGKRNIYVLSNDWTVVTRDGKPSAHFEHTVLVTKEGYEILTGDENGERS